MVFIAVVLLLIAVKPLLIVLPLLLTAFTLLLTIAGIIEIPLVALSRYRVALIYVLVLLHLSQLVRVQPLISYFSYMHYLIIVLHSCVVFTVFDLLERCVSLVLRLTI